MSTLPMRASQRGRVMVALVYGGLLVQALGYAIVSTLHLPRAVNALQFAAIAAELAGWIGLRQVTSGVADRRRSALDERERAEVDRAGWVAFRILGASTAVLTGGYLLLGPGGGGWVSAPSRDVLGFLAFSLWVGVWTLPSAILAWRHPTQVAPEC
jgi:hypothetical protein